MHLNELEMIMNQQQSRQWKERTRTNGTRPSIKKITVVEKMNYWEDGETGGRSYCAYKVRLQKQTWWNRNHYEVQSTDGFVCERRTRVPIEHFLASGGLYWPLFHHMFITTTRLGFKTLRLWKCFSKWIYRSTGVPRSSQAYVELSHKSNESSTFKKRLYGLKMPYWFGMKHSPKIRRQRLWRNGISTMHIHQERKDCTCYVDNLIILAEKSIVASWLKDGTGQEIHG